MQRFLERDAKYEYSHAHAPIGAVAAGERFEVECVEGYSNYFRDPSDFSPERYAEAEAVKWAVTGPIAVDGARAGGALAVTVHDVEVTGPGVVTWGAYAADADPYGWWDDVQGVAIYPVEDGVVRFDERTTLRAEPMIGCLAVAPPEGPIPAGLQGSYGGNHDSRHMGAGATVVLPVSHDGAGLYFGDCKALMGDGEVVSPPEVGAVVTASAEPRERPASMSWPRIESADSLVTIVSGRPLEWSARQAWNELLGWVSDDFELDRPRAALLLAMVAHAGICQVSNEDYSAYCAVPREALEPYGRN